MRKRYKEVTGYRLQVTGFLGQSLIEVVISIALAAILAISLISTTLITQKTSQSARNNTEATKLALELTEQLRILRDRQGYDSIKAEDLILMTPGDCRLDSSSSLISEWDSLNTGCGNDDVVLGTTIFDRSYSVVEISAAPDPERKLITVTISWDESGGQKQVTHDTIFSNWESF